MNRPLFLVALIAAAVTAGVATADTRYYAYEASGAAARHRTGDVTLEVRTPVMFFGSARVRGLWRRRGSDLPLGGPVDTFRAEAIRAAIGASAEGLLLYPVDEQTGRGFAQGACRGAARAWIATGEPRPYRPLTLYVLRQGESGAPELCETLEYTWRAEWTVPREGTRPEDPGTPNPY